MYVDLRRFPKCDSSLVYRDWADDIHPLEIIAKCNKNYISQPFQEKHAQFYPHKCNLCSKRFTQKGSLNRHMVTHNNERPFACELCPKRFKYRSVLTSHRKLHLKDSLLRCNICGTAFRLLSSLQAHTAICQNTTNPAMRL
ncbi:hypothetical protein TNIN_416231 [Trichonephila inaurata madagascariensis]|uniref:C2H2-type domain-containing protein n=1 Tax=Trichonephila inaurata madagascariensis TaxID=2747483 RepID=A0A8X6XAS8_9ARAC|nr:hypothetical protein TNIN_416231 [Trichonephila inaurata madagascariensis]